MNSGLENKNIKNRWWKKAQTNDSTTSVLNITGFSTLTTSLLSYQIIGKICFVNFFIFGTSNATTFTFDLPVRYSTKWHNTPSSGRRPNSAYGRDNGADITTPVLVTFNQGNNNRTVALFSTMTGSAWTASGTKRAIGSFWYAID